MIRSAARALFHRLPPLWRIRLKKRASLLYYDAGYGDTLMVAGIARELKKAVPGVFIQINGCKRELLRNSPYVDAVSDRYDGIDMNYHHGPHSAGAFLRENLFEMMGRKIGLRNVSRQVDIFLDESEREWARELCASLPRPLITIQAMAGPFAAGRKNWPIDNWRELCKRLHAEGCGIIQLGAAREPAFTAAINRLGAQDIRKSIAIIEQADLHAGVVSCLMHGAAAAGTQSVILYGGFEHARLHGYASVLPLESTIDCAPCMKAFHQHQPCPRSLACMHEISPEKAYWTIMNALSPKSPRKNIAAEAFA